MRALFLAALLLLLAPAHAATQETSALINLANDYASALKPAELNALETQLVEISRYNVYQIAVAIYPKLPPGAERDNATELADKLLVGSAADNRGLVIFVFLAEKVVRVEVGYGLEGLVPDATAHRIAEKTASRIAKGEMAAALREAIADLTPVLQSLKRVDQKSSRWEWLPDFALAIIDATRGVAFYATHHRELPKQLASWWRSNDAESRAVLTGFGALGALFLLYCLRPVVGALLLMALPLAAIPRRALYWVFFWGTDAVCATMLKPGSAQKIEKSGAVFDVLYYSFGVFLVVGCLLASFIMFVGHPGGFGGAGAWARW
jgi:uncharacterized membrane protein YgcG